MIRNLLPCLMLILSLSAQAGNRSIHSGTIIKDTVNALPNCLHYQAPVHYCVWISKWGVINTTPVLSHYLPDLVVSVYANPEDNPWFEINKLVDNIGHPIQEGIIKTVTGLNSGSGNHSLSDVHEQSVMFKEADVIGNPALAIIPRHGLLPSTATPWQPYFQSMTDSMVWRGLPPAALPEEGMAMALNVVHHVGTGLTNWGGIYPHEGKVIGENDVQASAVIAERATDLVTRHTEYGHIYYSLSTACGKHCSAAPVQENSKETHFQMIYPLTQTDCHILGESSSYKAQMINPKGAYVWIVWRHYEGCADGHGQYMGRV